MADLTRRQVELKATNLLKQLGVRDQPVDVEDVALSLGVQIERVELDDETSGLLVRREGKPAVIGVQWSHHPNRQRFTIAHEIGHFVLHKGGVFIDKGTHARFRDERSGSGTIVEERQANVFAAALLMPEKQIRSSVTDLKFDPAHDDDLISLANRFGVSIQAMTYRLANMGLLKL